ncbi:MAG TPA: efflux RND transporter periplasmic adaptor subunit [bacterium]|nr:efflux RND transporter periplasmic adaptor subunit [bacterium]
MKKKRLLWVISAVVLIIILSVAVKSRGKKKVEITYEEPKITVRVVPVEAGDVKEVVSVSGSVKPFSEVVVYSKSTGEVEKLFVREGQYVKKGEMIAQVDYVKSALSVQQLESQVAAAEANLDGLKRDYDRMQKLYEEGVISQKKWDDVRTAFDVASHNLEGLKAQLALAKVHLEDTKIVAPISGTVMKKFIDEGEIITDASMMKNSPLVSMADISRVKVVVPVAEVELGRIEKGKRAEVRVDAYPEKVFYGDVYKISPFVDPLTRTAEVEILVDNSGQFLKPGMFARAEIIIRIHKNAVLVPEKAIFTEGDRFYVLTVDGAVARKKYVKAGIKQNGKVEIIEGLVAEEKVVVEGGIGLEDGSKVEVSE